MAHAAPELRGRCGLQHAWIDNYPMQNLLFVVRDSFIFYTMYNLRMTNHISNWLNLSNINTGLIQAIFIALFYRLFFSLPLVIRRANDTFDPSLTCSPSRLVPMLLRRSSTTRFNWLVLNDLIVLNRAWGSGHISRNLSTSHR